MLRWLSHKASHEHPIPAPVKAAPAKARVALNDEEFAYQPGMLHSGIEVEELSINEFLRHMNKSK